MRDREDIPSSHGALPEQRRKLGARRCGVV
jgi:hypothetical protein